MTLDLSRQSRRFLETLPAKQLRQVVLKILQLGTNAYPQDSKKLAGYDYWRVDVGEYRVIYRLRSEERRVGKECRL